MQRPWGSSKISESGKTGLWLETKGRTLGASRCEIKSVLGNVSVSELQNLSIARLAGIILFQRLLWSL